MGYITDWFVKLTANNLRQLPLCLGVFLKEKQPRGGGFAFSHLLLRTPKSRFQVRSACDYQGLHCMFGPEKMS